MTTLLESKARPFGSSKGVVVSMVLHAAIIAAAVFATAKVVLPPREKVEEHPILYVATPPPPPITQPEPLVAVKAPPKAAAPRQFQAPRPQPRPKVPTTPALVAPTKVPLSVPSINIQATPTISDVVAPPVADVVGSGVPTSGTVARGGDAGLGASGGLGSGNSGRAYSENQVDRAVQVTRGAAPRYPDALKSVGVQGTVTVRFVVSADGRVEPGSIEVLSTPHKLFAAAVRTALLDTRYRPAEAGGRSVRQLVQQTFSFLLTKDGS
jgi:protein TonB